jgi:hypothetical protein
VTKKDAYPLPRIDDTLESLSGATCFSTIDLAAGYWQVEMTEEDKAKTAFVSHVGLFQFTKMPFGLCNAPSTFQRLMESVLAGLTWEERLVYLDDIIIYARNFNEHLERLKHVFERLRDGGLKIKLDKWKFLVEEVKYLGHTLTKYGLKRDNKKIECIKAWPTPVTSDELQSFLGLAAYYRRFIKGFAETASSLFKLTHKKAAFIWTEEHQKSFLMLIDSLVNAPT